MTDPEREHASHRAGTSQGKSPHGIIRPDEDAWPHIARHLPDALREAQRLLTDRQADLLPMIEARYREGERIHKRDWLTRDGKWFEREAMEEAADLVVYLAMRRVLAGES